MTPAKSSEHKELARVSEQLDELKRLMIVQLLASGVQSTHIAEALGIHASGISRIVPAREIQRVARRGVRNVESEG